MKSKTILFFSVIPVILLSSCVNNESQPELNNLNEKLLNRLNKSGKLYLTHTKIKGNFVIRMVVSQTYVTKKHVKNAWEKIKKMAQDII